MRAVFGLVALDGGEVAWQGRPIGRDVRLRFGYMPEQRGLYPRMRIGEQLAWLGRIHGMTAAAAGRAAVSWLERLGLAERSRDRLEQLSHGNQQRVQLAAALLHDPDALVLDEPFAGLDPMAAEALAEIIRERAAAGVDGALLQPPARPGAGRLRGRGRHRPGPGGARRVARGGAPPRPAPAPRPGPGRRRRMVPLAARHRVAGQPPGLGTYLVPADADPAALLADAARAGRITRFSFQPPTLSDLFREAVGR